PGETAYRITFQRSFDLGDTWSQPLTLNQHGDARRPSLAVDGDGGVYAAWYDLVTGSVFGAHSLTHGASWTQPALISHPGRYTDPEIVAHRDDAGDVVLHAIYAHRPNLFHRSSRDLGQSWSTPTKIPGIRSPRSSIVVDQSAHQTAHIAFLGGPSLVDVFFTAMQEDATGSQPTINLSKHAHPYSATFVTMAAPGRSIRHIVWTASGGQGVAPLRLSSSADGGLTWTSPRDITNDGLVYNRPHLVAESSRGQRDVLYLVAIRNPRLQTIFMKSTDGGMTWS